jgi:hypothetical protein
MYSAFFQNTPSCASMPCLSVLPDGRISGKKAQKGQKKIQSAVKI